MKKCLRTQGLGKRRFNQFRTARNKSCSPGSLNEKEESQQDKEKKEYKQARQQFLTRQQQSAARASGLPAEGRRSSRPFHGRARRLSREQVRKFCRGFEAHRLAVART